MEIVGGAKSHDLRKGVEREREEHSNSVSQNPCCSSQNPSQKFIYLSLLMSNLECVTFYFIDKWHASKSYDSHALK